MGMQALSSSMSTKIPGRPNTAITLVHQMTMSLTMLCMQPSVNDPAGRTQPAGQLPAARKLTDAALTVAASPVHLPQTMPRPVSYTHLRAHETRHDLVCRLLL